MRTFSRTVLVFALGLVSMHATAQVDERARELLEGMAAGIATEEVRTLDQTTVTTLRISGEEVVSTTRTVLDMERERVVVLTESMGITSRLVHQDGNTTMTVDGEVVPTSGLTELTLRNAFDLEAMVPLLEGEDASATFDGEVNYGGVLVGVQVTYTGEFGVRGLSQRIGAARFVFDHDGNLLGMVSEIEGMTLVSVFTGERHPTGQYDTDIYLLVGDIASPYASTRYESMTINDEPDESLFD